MTRDCQLEQYVDGLERVLTRLRGSAVTLSRRDFALARGWYEAGVPVGRVRDALEAAAARGAAPSSLAYVQRAVEGRPGRTGGRHGTHASEDGAPGKRDGIAELAAALDRLPEDARAAFAAVRAELGRLEAGAGGTAPEQLDALDRAVDEAALAATPEALAQQWRADAARARARQKRLSPAALDAAEARALVERARGRLGLTVRVGPGR